MRRAVCRDESGGENGKILRYKMGGDIFANHLLWGGNKSEVAVGQQRTSV